MKFNQRPSIGKEIENHPDLTETHEGGIAFKTDEKTELTLRFLTYLVGEPKFYTPNASDEAKEIRLLIKSVSETDPEYLMKLACYARSEMYLRSAPIFLLVESAQYDSVKPYIRKYTPKIVQRADELTETVAYFISKHGEVGARGKASIPNALKAGLADSFYNFDAYQFAKYDKDGTVKLRDVLRLVHPKPRNEEESTLFKQIKNRELPIPETWETTISGNGSTKENWDLIAPKMAYMAKLRNLRNFLKVGANLEPIIEHITNENAVLKSKQLPFRFFSAYREIEKTTEGSPFDRQKLLSAIETALEKSVKNIPKISGNTFITCDESGSMRSPLNARSSIQYIDIANIMGSLARYVSDNGLASVFGTDFMAVPMTNEPVLGAMHKIQKAGEQVGMSTNAFLPLKWLNANNIKCDRIMIFSDMQCYDSNSGFYGYTRSGSLAEEFKKYKRNINSNVKLYSFDLTGYGTVQFPQDEKNVVLISGWSDRILNFIELYERFGTTQMDVISSYSPILS